MRGLRMPAPRDPLSFVLSRAEFRSTIFGRSELTAPWGYRVAAHGVACFHVVLRGSCLLEGPASAPRMALTAGDFVIVTRGDSHLLKDAVRSVSPPLEEILAEHPPDSRGTLHYGGGGDLTVLLCGGFEFAENVANPLLASLPSVLHVLGGNGIGPGWLDTLLPLFESEGLRGRPGSETIAARLAEILFVEAIRTFLAGPGRDKAGLLLALSDPQIGSAVALIHDRPGERWTVANLGATVGLSRTLFATRFRELVGEPVLHHVRRCRMNRAARLLATSRSTIAEVAESVGYDSEMAFRRTFRQQMGVAPGAYRRRQPSRVVSS